MSLGITTEINYDLTPNAFSPARVGWILSSHFCSETELRRIANVICDFLQSIKSCDDTYSKGSLKDLKKRLQKQISMLIKTGSCTCTHFNLIYSTMNDKIRALNIIMTLVRWPEWYIEPESILETIKQNMSYYKKDINAINFYDDDGRICPYSPSGYINDRDFIDTIYKQEDNIRSWATEHHMNLRQIDARKIEEALFQLANDINDEMYIPTEFEDGFFRSIRYIQSKRKEIADKMRRFKSGAASSQMFSLSESRSIISNYEPIMQFLHKYGWTKGSCPNVLANIFFSPSYIVEFSKQQGQITIGTDLDYFDVAPGLGPAKKIRFVFNCDVKFQNYLGMLADLIKDADNRFDKVLEAYTDQNFGISLLRSEIRDGYSIDCTGYSDYLFRGIYHWIMKYLYRLDEDIINDIMNIFAMPLLIDGEKVPVTFGSMQGCKLLVFIMNHANRLIGILANRLGANIWNRFNAGDDVFSITRSCFTSKDKDIEMALFTYFNCPTNDTKTAWIARDGYCDFCSKYYTVINNRCYSITGIPPKILGKQCLSIKSFSEMMRILDIAGVDRNKSDFVWRHCRKVILPEVEIGLYKPNALKYKYNLEEKEKLALEYPISLGGLSEDARFSTTSLAVRACQLMERMLQFSRFKAEGIFAVIHNIQMPDCELFRCLGTVEQFKSSEILEMIEDLHDCRDGNIIDIQVVKHAIGMINRMQRSILKGLSHSRSSSTYHRKSATKDIDSFIPNEILEAETPLFDSIEAPHDAFSAALMLSTLASNDYAAFDKIRRYIAAVSLYNKTKDRYFQRTYGVYTNWYGTDDDGKVIKFTSGDRESDDFFNESGQFKHPKLIINKEMKSLYDLVSGNFSLATEILEEVRGTFYQSLKYEINKYLLEQSQAEKPALISKLRRQLMREIDRRYKLELKEMYPFDNDL